MQLDNQRAEAPALPTGTVSAPVEQVPARVRLQWLGMLLRNRKAMVGASILLFFVAVALLAPVIVPGDPAKFVARPNQPPSREHLLGTTGTGQDVFAQTIWGARTTLVVGFATGFLVMAIGALFGMSAGYFGGRIDDLLTLFTNVFLIIPGLPLAVVLASFLEPGPVSIVIALTVTGWAYNARVLRSQTLSLREKDFVWASMVSGENSARIIFREILPNMTSLVASGVIGATIYAIGAELGLEFLGLGSVSDVTWGTNLYWAANNAGLLTGAWWTIVPTGVCVALVGFSLSMLNYAIDEITNPRLRAEQELRNGIKQRNIFRTGHATPVVRRGSQQHP